MVMCEIEVGRGVALAWPHSAPKFADFRGVIISTFF
jgi:hypothetical protein